jgi:hypothetical protein
MKQATVLDYRGHSEVLLMDISCQLKLGGFSYPKILESRLWRCIENGLMEPVWLWYMWECVWFASLDEVTEDVAAEAGEEAAEKEVEAEEQRSSLG